MSNADFSDSTAADVWEIDAPPAAALQLILEHSPSAFAVTAGSAHTLIYANSAFRRLVGSFSLGPKVPITDVLLPEAVTRLQSLLDRALAGGEALHDRFLGPLAQGIDYWHCTIWPLCQATLLHRGLVIELHKAAPPSTSHALQREVTERLLLAALDEAEAAENAQTSLARLEFLEEASRRLGKSLDTGVTRQTVASLATPILGAWCIVDLVELDGSISRLGVIHPDPEKQALLRDLAGKWTPEPGDPFGGPAVGAGSAPVLIADHIDDALAAAAHSPENLRLLRELEIGTLLTVPMTIGERFLGAVTFVTARPGRTYSTEEIGLARKLAARSAEALESARSYEEALLLREQAELDTRSKLRFLGSISHELRTPLNAIVAYVELIEDEIHGPVTPAQRGDLERIRLNQDQLLKLVNELLNYVRAGTPRLNKIVALSAPEAVADAVGFIEDTMTRKSIKYECGSEDPDPVALGDRDRVQQILVNLLTNAVKFTQRGGQITTRCQAVEDQVLISVMDNGIGIARTKLEAIFEPFVQVDPAHPTERGVGLGLAISRDLARTMHGDLTVESAVGKGTCFTLTLPRAPASDSPSSPAG